MFVFERPIEQLIALAPVNSIQTGYIDNPTFSCSGFPDIEESRYYDIDLTESPYTPVDITKSICQFDGKITVRSDGMINVDSGAHYMGGVVTIKFIDSSTLRICSPCQYIGGSACSGYISGRWYVIEYA